MTVAKPTASLSLGSWASVVAASVAAAIIASALASWGNTSDSALVTHTEVQYLKSEVKPLKATVQKNTEDINKAQTALHGFETHQRYLRQQSEHTERKVDALLDHFGIKAPAEPALPPSDLD